MQRGLKSLKNQANIIFDNYKRCLDTQQEIYQSMNIFRNQHHQIYTQEVNKYALSAQDTKRQTELAPFLMSIIKSMSNTAC